MSPQISSHYFGFLKYFLFIFKHKNAKLTFHLHKNVFEWFCIQTACSIDKNETLVKISVISSIYKFKGFFT